MSNTRSKKYGPTARTEIRIIKKGEIRRIENTAVVDDRSSKRAARRMVSAVRNWVSEFEARQLEEIRMATERFQHNF
ncbi:MAG: hypothetical protein IT173_13955 [Acidobacteria bacterium]|nr:hypothetical protein [Acidobacteriota bacterium]